MLNITFGERLRRMRTKEYITQGELGAKLGISRAAVSLYELDKREPDIEALCSICKYFDVSADYLLGLKKDQTTEKKRHMETTTKTVSQRIKEQRLASSLTQTELGEKVGKSKQWVSEVERGHIKLSFDMAVTLSKLFRKTPEFFYKHLDDPTDYLLGLKEDQAEGKEKHMTLRDLVLKVSDHTTVEVHIRMLGMDFSTSHFAEVYLEDDKKREDSRVLMDKTIKKIWVRDDLLVVHLEE